MTLASHKRIRSLAPGWLDYFNQRLPGETPHPLDDFFRSNTLANYTQTTPTGSATPSIGRDLLSWHYTGQSTQDIVPFTKAFGAISAPITIETAVTIGGTDSSSNNFAGVCFTDGTATTSNTIFLGIAGVGSRVRFVCYEGTVTLIAAALLDANQVEATHRGYFRLCWKTTNTFRIACSVDGVTWANMGTGDRSFTMTPTRLGPFVSSYGSAQDCMARHEYLRVAPLDLATSAL